MKSDLYRVGRLGYGERDAPQLWIDGDFVFRHVRPAGIEIAQIANGNEIGHLLTWPWHDGIAVNS